MLASVAHLQRLCLAWARCLPFVGAAFWGHPLLTDSPSVLTTQTCPKLLQTASLESSPFFCKGINAGVTTQRRQWAVLAFTFLVPLIPAYHRSGRAGDARCDAVGAVAPLGSVDEATVL